MLFCPVSQGTKQFPWAERNELALTINFTDDLYNQSKLAYTSPVLFHVLTQLVSSVNWRNSTERTAGNGDQLTEQSGYLFVLVLF